MKSDGPQEIIVACDSNCLSTIRTFVRDRAVQAGLKRTDVGRLVLAADEVSSNILRHTYQFDWRHKIAIGWHSRDDRVMVEIRDDSPIPYLPLMADFDVPTKVKHRQASGYGKHLIRQAVDDVEYATVPGSHNSVLLVKFRGDHPRERCHGRPLESPLDLARVRSLFLRALFDVWGELDRQKDPEQLINLLLYTIMGQLSTRTVVLLRSQGPSKQAAEPLRLAGQMGLPKRIALADPLFPGHGWVMETLWAHRGPFLTEEFRKLHVPPEEMEVLEKIQSRVLVPLFVLGELQGIVSLGDKRNSQPFSQDDMSFVTLLGSHVLLLLGALSSRPPCYHG